MSLVATICRFESAATAVKLKSKSPAAAAGRRQRCLCLTCASISCSPPPTRRQTDRRDDSSRVECVMRLVWSGLAKHIAERVVDVEVVVVVVICCF